MFDGMTSQQLIALLSTIEPVDLKGLALLRQRQTRPGHWFPGHANVRELAAATTQMITYTQECARLVSKLQDLQPVPLDVPVEEWPL